MKLTFLMFLGGLVVLSPAANATATCQSILAVSNTFQALETASSCDVGNVLFSGFNTSLTASNVLVATNGGASSVLGSLLGFTYDYVGGTLPGGTIGWTATFDSTGGVGCPAGFHSCGIDGLESQLHVVVPNPAVVSTVFSGGYVGSSQVDGASLADQTDQIGIPLVIAPTSVTKLSTYNGAGSLSSFETDVITGGIANAPAIPEPATLGMLGSGLIGLGLMRRRATRKN